MLTSKIGKLADMIMENETNPNIDKDIIVYGLNSAIQQIVSMITAIILGFLFGLTLEIIVFMVSFTFIRIYAGGYHCKKAINCYFASNGIIIAVLIVTKFMPIDYIIIICLGMLLLSLPIIMILSPIETPTKPLEEVEKNYYKKKVIKYLIIEILTILVLYFMNLHTILFVVCLGITMSAIVLVLQKIVTLKW